MKELFITEVLRRKLIKYAISAFVLIGTAAFPSVFAQTSAFNFQGRLNDGTDPANGHYDLQFKLYDASTGGNRIGPIVNRLDQLLVNGVFSTTLFFGPSAFRINENRFIEISVRPAGSPNAYVILGARQQVSSVPYAIHADLADFADNANNATQAANSDFAQNSANLGGVPAGDYARLNVANSGNAAFGTVSPNTRLTLSGGPTWTSSAWTASMNMQNASAMGWEANTSGQRFGIGQTNGGLYFFRTISSFGSTLTPAQVDVRITDNGNITQPIERNGLAKAMVFVDPTLPADQYIVRCYNGITDSSSGNCGFTMKRLGVGNYFINFGFQVSDRFFYVTAASAARTAIANASGSNAVHVDTRTIIVDPGGDADSSFYLIVF